MQSLHEEVLLTQRSLNEHGELTQRRIDGLENMVRLLVERLGGDANEATAIKLQSPQQTTTGQIMQHPAAPTEPEAPFDHIEDEASGAHITGAQHLMTWPIIKTFFHSANIDSQDYVGQETGGQDALRPFGTSTVLNGRIKEYSDAYVDYEKSENLDPAQGTWGKEIPSRDPNQDFNLGGNNANGKLLLDDWTVRSLMESYMRNMWNIHPFLDAEWLKEKIEHFIHAHSPMQREFIKPGPPASSGRSDTPLSASSGKRKRQLEVGDEPPNLKEPPGWQPRDPTTPERSMENALVLLVLALGKVLSEHNFLLGPKVLDPSGSGSYESSRGSHGSSPMDSSRPSPRTYDVYDSAASPGDMKPAMMARGASGDRLGQNGKGKKMSNVDLYPGLAYFAQAAAILGDNFHGNKLIHAQAFLLAGLYYGQLGRVMESWAWINAACRVTTVMQGQPRCVA